MFSWNCEGHRLNGDTSVVRRYERGHLPKRYRPSCCKRQMAAKCCCHSVGKTSMAILADQEPHKTLFQPKETLIKSGHGDPVKLCPEVTITISVGSQSHSTSSWRMVDLSPSLSHTPQISLKNRPIGTVKPLACACPPPP
jgi:hypothetical protein